MTNSNVYFLKPAQIEDMRDAAHTVNLGPRNDALVTLLYDTGLRRAELAALDVDMLDLDEDELRIPASIQKDYPNENSPSAATFELDRSGKLRTARTIRSYFAANPMVRARSEALFPSQKSRRMTGKAINEVVKKLADRADVRPHYHGGRGEPVDVTAHTLRHSVAWRMLRDEDGNTLYDVRNRLRHSTILTTERRYDHFTRI